MSQGPACKSLRAPRLARTTLATAVTMSIGLIGAPALAQQQGARPSGQTVAQAAPQQQGVPAAQPGAGGPPPQAPPPGYGPPPPGYSPPPPGYAQPGYGPPPPGYTYIYPPPPPPPPPPVEKRRRSVGMMVAGAVLTGIGGAGIITGAALIGDGTRTCTYQTSFGFVTSQDCSDASEQRAGAIVLVGGAVLLAAGIPLLIIGAHKVPVNDRNEPREQALRPVLFAGARGATMRMRF